MFRIVNRCVFPFGRQSLRFGSTERTYEEALTCLNSLQTNYKAIQEFKNNNSKARKTTQAIDEMKEYMRRLGYSHDLNELDTLKCIHITGTKGKGSTAAFTHSILNAYNSTVADPKQKLKLGLYTSPHLKTCRERIRIGGEPISKELFTKYFFQVWDKLNTTESDPVRFPDLADHKKPGYFKFLTLLSFHTFIQEKCTTCIFEVGIGGKYDSTNIIPNPTVTGVSLLGIDHVNVLGHTLEEICGNKVGIYKKNAQNFTIFKQPKQKEMFNIMNERLKEINCQNKLNVISPFKELENVELGIKGDFQIVNASLAAALSLSHLESLGREKLNVRFPARATDDGLIWDAEMALPQFVTQGLVNCKWEGRCQILEEEKTTWFLDGAHTLDSIEKSAEWFVQEEIKRAKKGNLRVLLFNQQSRDENLKDFLTYIHSCMKSSNLAFDEIIFSTNKTWSEGYNADLVSMNVNKEQVDSMEVQKKLRHIWLSENDGRAKISIFESIEESYKYIKAMEPEKDVFVTGSLHLVGGLLVVMDGREG